MWYIPLHVNKRMRYHGGKTKTGKAISRVVLKTIQQCDIKLKGYAEPFCGMCGVLIHVVQNSILPMYLASDNNESVISMWTDVRDGWRPDTTTFNEERYNALKGNGESSAEKGFFGHAVTFGALYFQCYRPDLLRLLDYSLNDVVKRSSVLNDVVFSSGDYSDIMGIDHSVVYCDPPYERRNRYYDEFNRRLVFDSDKFWRFCEKLSELNIVIISEHIAFFDKRVPSYSGNIRVVKLPGHPNRFGKTCRDSGEHVCIMTSLAVNLEEIIF